MMKVYRSYPDIRIVKALGTSFTFDMGEFCTAMRVYRFSGQIPVNDAEQILVNTWAMDKMCIRDSDIIDLSSYEKGIEILKEKYGVEL